MHHFFVSPGQIVGKKISIVGEDVNHIKNVLRMRPGQEIAVSNGEDGREYRCQIDGITETEVTCTLRFIKEDGLELSARVYLFQGLPKGDKMELIVQKAVELGAAQVIPVSTRRSVVKLDAKKAAKKTERWQEIARSAAKQAGRGYIPKVTPVMSYRDALEYAKELDVLLIPYELERGMDETKSVIESIRPGQSVAVFIGPEGGFEREEVEQALEHGAKAITLGRRILRTETAGLAALSILMFHLED